MKIKNEADNITIKEMLKEIINICRLKFVKKYEDLEAVIKKREGAFVLLNKMAEQGNVEAMYYLARVYENGCGKFIAPNRDKYKEWMTKMIYSVQPDWKDLPIYFEEDEDSK